MTSEAAYFSAVVIVVLLAMVAIVYLMERCFYWADSSKVKHLQRRVDFLDAEKEAMRARHQAARKQASAECERLRGNLSVAEALGEAHLEVNCGLRDQNDNLQAELNQAQQDLRDAYDEIAELQEVKHRLEFVRGYLGSEDEDGEPDTLWDLATELEGTSAIGCPAPEATHDALREAIEKREE